MTGRRGVASNASAARVASAPPWGYGPAMLMPLLLLACGQDPSPETGAPDSGVPVATIPDLPSGGCGLPEHAWLPLEEMGQLVAVQEVDELSLSAASVDALLNSVDMGVITPVQNGVRTFQVRYTTQDKGLPVEATGFLVVPDTATAGQDLPLVLWQHPTTGFNDACAPTALGFVGAAFPILWASMGFAVAAPDYLGMAGWGTPSERLHPWMVVEPTAVVSLDGARAMLRFAEERAPDHGLDFRPDTDHVLVWGASEGGFAALWADRYAAEYAPELEISGVIAAIPPTDAAALATRGVQSWSATTAGIAAAAVSMWDWYEGEAPLSELLESPYDETVVQALATTCGEVEVAFPGAETVEDVYTEAFRAAALSEDWDSLQPWGCYLESATLREATVPRGSDAPVLVITAENDDLAWPEPVHRDIGPLCEQGYVIEHVQCAGADHVSGAVQTLFYQVEWARAATAGTAPLGEQTCVVAAPVDCATVYAP